MNGSLVENIPNEQDVFYRIHRNWLNEDGSIRPGVFRNQGTGMSVDWEKHSTAWDSRNRARTPSENGIVRGNVGDLRLETNQDVLHTPSPKNRSHSEVRGAKDEEVRYKMIDIFDWEIRIFPK